MPRISPLSRIRNADIESDLRDRGKREIKEKYGWPRKSLAFELKRRRMSGENVPRVDYERKRKIEDLILEGENKKGIGKALGVSRERARQLLEEYDLAEVYDEIREIFGFERYRNLSEIAGLAGSLYKMRRRREKSRYNSLDKLCTKIGK